MKSGMVQSRSCAFFTTLEFDRKTVKVWDAVSGKELVTLRGHAYSSYVEAYSPDPLLTAERLYH